MEPTVNFKESEFSKGGTHLESNQHIIELQGIWEDEFHRRIYLNYTNLLEGHPVAMRRLTMLMDGEDTDYDFGSDLIDGEIDIDVNLEMENYSDYKTIYAIGSQFHGDEDNPLVLVKNDGVDPEVLILKYVKDDEDGEEEVALPVDAVRINERV